MDNSGIGTAMGIYSHDERNHLKTLSRQVKMLCIIEMARGIVKICEECNSTGWQRIASNCECTSCDGAGYTLTNHKTLGTN